MSEKMQVLDEKVGKVGKEISDGYALQAMGAIAMRTVSEGCSHNKGQIEALEKRIEKLETQEMMRHRR